MENIILAVVLLGGCFLMHFLMMRGKHGKHGENEPENKNKDGGANHSGHGCCH